MKIITGAAAALTLASGAFAQQSVPRYDAETFYDTESVNGSSFSPDETTILVSSDRTGVFNAFTIPITGGQPTQLTNSETDATFAVSYFPHDERILVTADQGGNELNHLYVRLPDGTLKDITPGQNVKAQFAGWAGDLQHFYVTTNERNPQFFDVYRYDAETYERTMLFRNDEGFSPGDISRDGRWMTLGKTNTNADSDIYLLDLAADDAEPRLITQHAGEAQYNSMTFTPDSSTLLYGSNENDDFTRVWSFDVATGEREILIDADWDVMYVGFSWDGAYRYHATNDDARTVISIIDTTTGSPLDLPAMPAGDITGVNFSRSGEKMAFYVNGDTSPSNLYVMDMASKKVTRLTDTLSKKINEKHLVSSEVIRFQSFDGLEIPSLLYKPKGASAQNPAPMMLYIHGGPGGQTRTGYNPVIQHLVNHGYAILAVNNRGSSGYGSAFFHMDDKRHGDVDLKDCVWGKRWAAETLDWVDADKIGIMGGSYGGYMTAAALAFHPEEFAVGVNIFGVTNWLRTLESIPPWWAAFRDSLYDELGDPAEDRDRLYAISPLFHAENIVRPLMVIQGANDPRVLQVESDELVDAVQENGVPVEYIVFPDEGHGFRKKENRIRASEGYVSFLDRYLKGD
ncbi:MAG: S9 family peptidase [Phycisphaerales bacterium]